MSGGKGFLGVHSASDTLYEWPDYGRLVGAYFKEHPWTRQATVVVEDTSHPATAGLGDRFALMEEFYTFRENPRPRVQVLLRLDPASVGASGDFRWHGRNRLSGPRVLQRARPLSRDVAGHTVPAADQPAPFAGPHSDERSKHRQDTAGTSFPGEQGDGP